MKHQRNWSNILLWAIYISLPQFCSHIRLGPLLVSNRHGMDRSVLPVVRLLPEWPPLPLKPPLLPSPTAERPATERSWASWRNTSNPHHATQPVVYGYGEYPTNTSTLFRLGFWSPLVFLC